MAVATTEFLWCRTRWNLPKPGKKTTVSVAPVVFLGGVSVPPAVERVLERGPKFSLETSADKFELLAAVHRIADKTPTEEKERCVSEGVESLQRSYEGSKDNQSVLRRVVRHFHDLDLSLLLADKEGSFTVLPNKLFGEKAMLAINKNFKLADTRSARAKTRAVKMLEELNLEALAKRARNCKLDVLKVFFAAKTHKVECPLRAIVTERDSWQAQVSRFLQLHLSNLIPEDPYKVSSSDHLIELLREGLPGVNNAFSLDVEELFYSVPHDELLVAVRELIETSGVLAFQNACGVTADAFLEVLDCYLKSTLVCLEDKVYVQRRGICIGRV
ncbi:hypothetical protein HPB47_017059 [Ixodes persulcatus]|uniref:Uncharacterized protein n=1 Tax=Ixodes persulcatus TaxID=34615 RepID=A0AC60QPA2_IXOPE|nr:hypothetical protein HPB47_017059 [Ixodes persulcatus]